MKDLYLGSDVRRLENAYARGQAAAFRLLQARAVKALYSELRRLRPRRAQRFQILAGKGNNGGDARLLHQRLCKAGYVAELFELGDLPRFRPRPGAWVIDGLFGYGFRGRLPRACKVALGRLKTHKGKVIAIDVPSGLNCETGIAAAGTPRCDHTFCLGYAKFALYLPFNAAQVGRVHELDIGLPSAPATLHLLQARDVRVPARRRDSHKKSWGSLQIVGGDRGYAGAGILCALGAFKGGCGYVALKSNDRSALRALPELILGDIESPSAAVVGPGLKRLSPTWFKRYLRSGKPLLLDAAALTYMPRYKKLLRQRPNTAITPHPGELARLLKMSTQAVQADRLAAARRAAAEWGVAVLLKGCGTLVAAKKHVYLLTMGNEGMATAGQGDLLSGVIGALLAAGFPVPEALLTAAFLHGAAADRLAEQRKARQGLLAHEVAQLIPVLMQELRARRRASTRN